MNYIIDNDNMNYIVDNDNNEDNDNEDNDNIKNSVVQKFSITLKNIIDRDFKKNTFFIPNDKHFNIVNSLFNNFISYEQFINLYFSKKSNKSIMLLDTCSILLNDFNEVNPLSLLKNNTMYIITCGVFLEILQGINHYTITNDIFMKDLYKLVKLKEYLKENCVFLLIGRKFRSYWDGYKPSISCRHSNNDNQPHYKLLRDIDTELCRLSNLFNCLIYTNDKFLQKRNFKIIKNKQ